jgi:hypothetical protein
MAEEPPEDTFLVGHYCGPLLKKQLQLAVKFAFAIAVPSPNLKR